MTCLCGECKELLKKEDQVILNEMNCLAHKTCYRFAASFIKDSGTYSDMIEKYWFFQEQTH